MILFIHFKRFKMLPNGPSKDNTNIDIPLELDINEYCDNTMRTDSFINYKYKLKGISNHYGVLHGGHYTANCLSIVDNKTWYNFDDSRISKFNDSNIDTSSSYILMYEMNE